MGLSVWKAAEVAAKVAETSNAMKYRLGAVAVRRKEVLSVGANMMVYPGSPDHRGLHAEENAIRRVDDPNGVSLVVVRIGWTGNWLLARPCDTCWDLICKTGVRRVFYSIDNHRIGAEWVGRNLPKKIIEVA